MHKSKLIVILVIGLILGGGSIYAANQIKSTDTKTANSVVEIATASDIVKFTANSDDSVLKQLTRINDTVVAITSEQGVYVDSINGLKGGTDGKYWTLYVDGTMSPVGADKLITKGGEIIEWKFQKL